MMPIAKITNEYVEFRTFGGELRRIYKANDPSGYFLMASGPHAPMHGLDRPLHEDDYDHMQTYTGDLA